MEPRIPEKDVLMQTQKDTPPVRTEVLKEKYAIVVILDVLGVRSMSLDESRIFIIKKDELIVDIKRAIEGLTKFESILKQLLDPKIITFGDSIIIYWTDNEELDAELLSVGEVMRWIIRAGIKNGLLLRGAISSGLILISNETTIVGPAITDAASWCDRAEWAGVILTPNCSLRLSSVIENASLDGIDKICYSIWFEKYGVPFKEGGTHDLWAISWPSTYFQIEEDEHITRNLPKAEFLDEIKKFAIPFGAERKYANIVDFFDYYKKKAHLVVKAMNKVLGVNKA